MTKEREKKVGKDQLLLEASRLGRLEQLESILSHLQQLKCKKKANPLASLRKIVGPNSIRDPVTGFTCLHHASLNGHADCVQLILDHGAKVNAVDYKGSSALHLAAWVGNLEVVRILLAHQASSCSPREPTGSANFGNESQQFDEQQSTSRGTRNSNRQQRRLSCIDIDLCNNDNQTPLSLAAQFGHTEVVRELLASGASILIRNNQLESPLDLACLNGRLETVDLLLRSGPILVAELRCPRATLSTASASLVGSAQLNSCNSSSSANSSHPIAAASLSSPLAASSREAENHRQLDSCKSANSPPSSSQAQAQTVRRQNSSGSGWSALLRGKRIDSSSHHQSPLHRLTTGTLSMRQKQVPTTTTIAAANPLSFSSSSSSPIGDQSARDHERRETLVAGASIPATAHGNQRQQLFLLQHQRQLSADWAPFAATNSQQQQQQPITSEQTQEQALAAAIGGSEQLLDHSPLHYATRRGHLNVINLLLYTYQANLLQVTSRGSILHEIALNNGKHSDIIDAAFVYLRRLPEQNRLEIWDTFFNLRNAKRQTVFEVLSEINNRSAQEIKRLIYEFSEQIHQMTTTANSTAQQQQHRNLTANTQTNNDLKNEFSSQSQQQMHQFSDIHQINSFVTLKRAPKNGQRQQQQVLADATDRYLNLQQQQSHQLLYGTQTIDRRQTRNDQITATGRQTVEHSQFHPLASAGSVQSNQLVQQQRPMFGLSQSPAMTRSVSNLNRLPSQHCQFRGVESHPEQPTNFARRDWQSNCGLQNNNKSSGFGQQQQQLQQQQVSVGSAAVAARKRRSRSRDLGSLLMAQQQQLAEKQTSQAYDAHNNNNNNSNNSASSPFDNAPLFVGGQQQQPPQTGSSYLVRSQTDCTHLMNRFFGEQLNRANNGLNGLAPAGSVENSNLQQQQAQKHLTLDRKMINRHYHVYDHEFYPPRLLGSQVGGCHQVDPHNKQMVAVVPPLSRATDPNSLRASVRSTASCQVPSTVAASSGGKLPAAAVRQLKGFVGNTNVDNNNSRLSLNIEPQVSMSNGGRNLLLDFDGRKPANSAAAVPAKGQEQMDRFLHGHSRKSTHGAPTELTDCEPNNRQQFGQVSRGTSIADQARHELVELQRRLIAESASQQQQQQFMHTSYSLESHLSEPQLFETTRKALMHDFDQMIGNKLLNRDHRQIIDGGLIQQQQQALQAAQTSSAQSILTGVSLDMDRFGERLTVSGTRITIPCERQQQQQQLHMIACDTASANSDCISSSNISGLDSVSAPMDKKLISPESNISNSNSTQTTTTDFEDYDECPREPPPKPPRLSLMSKQQQTRPQQHLKPQRLTTSQRVQGGGHVERVMIYDLPETDARDRQKQQLAQQQQQKQQHHHHFPAKLARLTLHSKPPPTSKPPPVPNAPLAITVKLSSASQPISSPLHVMASGTQPALAPADSSSSSTGSSLSSVTASASASAAVAAAVAENAATVDHSSIGLLKMASITSAGTGCSEPSSSPSFAPPRPQAPHCGAALALTLRTAQSAVDPDSGVCTSNSPASLSHDSEDPAPECSNSSLQSSVFCSSMGSKRAKHHIERAINGAECSSSLAIVRHAIVASRHAQSINNTAQPPLRHSLTQASNETNDKSSMLLLNTAAVETSLDDPLNMAPPSPKTAQLCIEEALMPLAKSATADVANQTTSSICMSTTDQFVSPYSVSFVDRWLVESPAQKAAATHDGEHDNDDINYDDESGRHSTEADYENCHEAAFQLQLQTTRCRSIGELLLEREFSRKHKLKGRAANDDDSANEEEEGDYAAESRSASSGEQTASDGSTSSGDSLKTQQAAKQQQQPIDNSGQQRKEVVLRVMIDETEQNSGGDEVFYINPLELKRLAKPNRRAHSDAETLTDEELCAALDKNSGFIRFTLRKRRNDEANGSTIEPNQAQQGKQQYGAARPTSVLGQTLAEHLNSAKKTKLNLEDEQDNETSETRSAIMMMPDTQQSNHLKLRHHSELTHSDNNHCSLLSSGQCQLQTSSPTGWRQDLNNCNGETSTIARSQINRQSAEQLRQWFSINLVALCDYVDMFLNFGLDNLQFLNHPQLMDDNVLKMVGIKNEPHRVIILDRISNELPIVDFRILFIALPAVGRVPLAKVLELLQMSHLQTMTTFNENQQAVTLVDVECIEQIKKLDLSAGYRARLTIALNFILNEIQGAGNKLHRQQQQQSLTKQVSPESTSEIEMDTSQTSSSSSKESIKSIVSMRQTQQQPEVQVATTVRAQAKDETAADTVCHLVVQAEPAKAEQSSGDVDQENKLPAADDELTEERKEVKETQPEEQGTQETSNRLNNRTTSSLVSEAARKLEAVAAKKGGSATFALKPVAAARRINNTKSGHYISCEKSDSSNQTDPNAPSDSSRLDGARATPVFVPVRSVCWPPKSNQQQQQRKLADTQCGQVTWQSTLNSKWNCSSASKRNAADQEQSLDNIKTIDKIQLDGRVQQLSKEQLATENSSNKVGPKPPKPPKPAKPAKLPASKFSSNTNFNGSHRL